MARDPAGNQRYDAAIVGGGVSGCATALNLAWGGMKVAVLERGSLCREASNANAGTLSIQIKRASLVPYAIKSWELWRTTRQWLGAEVGFVQQGGLTLAFDDDEVEMLSVRMGERRAAGAPIEIMDVRRAQRIEPNLSGHAKLVSYCPMDAFANSLLTGMAFRGALVKAGVAVREGSAVTAVDREGEGYAISLAGGDVVRARTVVLAGGVWLGRMLRWFGLDIPVECGVNMVTVSERVPQILRTVIMNGRGTLTLKQKENGIVLFGGGWEGLGDIDRGGVHVILENLIGNLRLAHYAVPAVAGTRAVRTWLGLDANVPDFMPLAGPVPGARNAFVLGCVRGGYTIGPYIGRLLAQAILGQEPEMPLFDPARYAPPVGRQASV